MIHIVMGKPGVGKSTYLAKMAQKKMKKGINVFSNVYIEGAYEITLKSDLNKYLITDGLVIIDEAGFEFNARDFKKFSTELYRFFTMHRHYNLDVVLAVQFWDRLDIVIRELVRKITVVKPTLLGLWFIRSKDIKCDIDISEEKQIVELFSWKLFSTRYYYKKSTWHLFDSFYRDDLPNKEFKRYGEAPGVITEGNDKLLHQSEEPIQL